MKQDINEITLNGVTYVPKGSEILVPKTNVVLVRTETAGVFFGEIGSYDAPSGIIILKNARRVWYWSGAASLSQLAVDGTNAPKSCKFPTAVSEITLAKVIEVIAMTKTAVESLNSVPVWKQ